MAREYMQHETRQDYVFRDQHGRGWQCIVDTRTKPHLAPCTPLEPHGWLAPVMPPGDLVRAHPTQLGTLMVLYSLWIERADEAEANYLQTLRQVADKMFGDDAPRAVRERDARLIAEVGEPPESAQFVRAAAAGHPWVLGIDGDDKMPQWAKALLHTLPKYRKQQAAERISLSAFPTYEEELAMQQQAATPDAGELALVGGESEETPKPRTRK